MAPNFFEVTFAIFGEKSGERGFFEKGAFDFGREELGNFPVID